MHHNSSKLQNQFAVLEVAGSVMGCPLLEALGPPSLKVFKTRWDKTLSNPA